MPDQNPTPSPNAVICLHCGERIESRHRHDFVCCGCPEETQICVDGGHDYQRRVYGPKAHWREEDTGEIGPFPKQESLGDA